MSADSPVLIDRVGAAGVITLNRPDARNAINQALRSGLADALDELDADANVAAIVLTGADPAFCAGLDLKEISTQGLGGGDSRPTRLDLPLSGPTKPIIGAINGPAVTGGLEYAVGCDFLVASELARFADTHARVGVMPGWGLTVLLPQAIGIRRAKQMSFTGNYIDATTALEWGLVNEVVAHDNLVARAVELANDMATISPKNLAGIKDAYRTAAAPGDDAALAAERSYSVSWTFDKAALASSREDIQRRGSEQI